MNGYFKLIDAVKSPTTINVAEKSNGRTRNKHVKLFPGEKYKLPDDEVYIASLKAAKVQRPKTKDLEDALKRSGVPYEEKACKSCGGRVIKLHYCVIEVVILDE